MSGAIGRNTLAREDGERVVLKATDEITAARGDVIVIETPGGGGYGDKDMNPER